MQYFQTPDGDVAFLCFTSRIHASSELGLESGRSSKVLGFAASKTMELLKGASLRACGQAASPTLCSAIISVVFFHS